MYDADEDIGVRLGLMGASLGLRPAGEGFEADRHEAFPVLLTLDAGHVQMRRACTVVDVGRFCDALETMHRSLKGSAQLASLDDVSVSVSGVTSGGVEVLVEAGDSGAADYYLRVEFRLDQGSVQPFARALRAAFPSRATS